MTLSRALHTCAYRRRAFPPLPPRLACLLYGCHISRREQYRQAAHLLEAVAQLAAGFSAYEAVPRLAAVLGRIQAVQGQLGTRVLDEFRSSMASADAQLGPEQLERLASACLVIDVLGPRVSSPRAAG